VTLDQSSNVTVQQQAAPYPPNPGGKTGFYAANPPRIVAQYKHKGAPATADGQYVITWSAPAGTPDNPYDTSLIRYYNIYAKDGADPYSQNVASKLRQNAKIASVPASDDYDGRGLFTYVDWVGATDGTTEYTVTAVDYQGNESVPSGAYGPRTLKKNSATP
jgi:hypothetical protein